MYNSMNRLSLIVCLIALATSAAFAAPAQAKNPADQPSESAAVPPTNLPKADALEALVDAQRALNKAKKDITTPAIAKTAAPAKITATETKSAQSIAQKADNEQSKQASNEVLTSVVAESVAESILKTAGIQPEQASAVSDADRAWADPSLANIDNGLNSGDQELAELDNFDDENVAELTSGNSIDDAGIDAMAKLDSTQDPANSNEPEDEAASLERIFAFFDLVANTLPTPEVASAKSDSTKSDSAKSDNSGPLSGVSLASLRALTDRLLTPSGEGYFVLAPHIGDPAWLEAVDLMRADRCAEALTRANKVLGGAPDPKTAETAVVYAYARMQMCGNNEAVGRQTMQKLAKGGGAVGELARRRLGMGIRIERGADDADGGMYLSQRLNQIRTENKKKDVALDATLKELHELQEASTTSWDRYRVRMVEAQILEDAGQKEKAQKVYTNIYRQTRTWKAADTIIAELQRAEKRIGLDIILFGDRIDLMSELIARGNYRQARQVSVENVKMRNPSATEVKGWTLFRQALESERDKKRELAVSQFAQADRIIKDTEVRQRLYIGWARALRRLDRDPEAIALYDRLCEEHPGSILCDEALYEAGRLHQFVNEHEKAREKFAALVETYPESSHVPDALWRTALSAYLMDDFKATEAPLLAILKNYGSQKDESELTMGLKAKYWLGTSALKAGDKKAAARWLQDTINSGPLTWYGRLAVARMDDAGMKYTLRVPQSKLTAADLRDLSTLRVPENGRLAVASEMVRLGLLEDALKEVRQQIAIYPVPEGAERMRAALHLALGEPNWGHWIMKSQIEESGPTHATLRDWGTAFPLDYMELSHKFGTEYGVSPFLVQAIIRQESGFRPTVASYAGAKGLMQLMPATARYTARVFLDNQPVPNDKQIVNPETNVRLGSMYIRVHTAHAADMIPLALAGYNAGPAPLKSWFERYGDRELDVFVESITYREARGYVRKVMTSYITYSALYGDGTLPDISLKMPDKLRRWGQIPEVKPTVKGEPVSMNF